MNIEELKRFWSKVTVLTPNECWEWVAGKDSKGYGVFSLKRKSLSSHRISWIIHNGPIPVGEGYHGTCVLHTCDNPSCVNPQHLFLGSAQDNMTDKVLKGRGSCGRGEQQGHSILTEAQVLNIKVLLLDKSITQKDIGNMFDVKRKVINDINTGKTWRHVC